MCLSYLLLNESKYNLSCLSITYLRFLPLVFREQDRLVAVDWKFDMFRGWFWFFFGLKVWMLHELRNRIFKHSVWPFWRSSPEVNVLKRDRKKGKQNPHCWSFYHQFELQIVQTNTNISHQLPIKFAQFQPIFNLLQMKIQRINHDLVIVLLTFTSTKPSDIKAFSKKFCVMSIFIEQWSNITSNFIKWNKNRKNIWNFCFSFDGDIFFPSMRLNLVVIRTVD
jgi:hypothetical protein